GEVDGRGARRGGGRDRGSLDGGWREPARRDAAVDRDRDSGRLAGSTAGGAPWRVAGRDRADRRRPVGVRPANGRPAQRHSAPDGAPIGAPIGGQVRGTPEGLTWASSSGPPATSITARQRSSAP